MLWLCLHLPYLAIETATADAAAPTAVAEPAGPRRLVVGANVAARVRGVVNGMPVPRAQSLVPALRLLPHRPHVEQAALRQLAGWALQYTSYVHLPVAPPEPGAGRLLLEIGGSFRLFGGQAALIKRVSTDLAALGYTGQSGIAAQPIAAMLLARAPAFDRLEALPVDLLELPIETREVLQASGLRSIGEVLKLPRTALGRRFGPECLDYLARLTGEQPDPVPAYTPPEHYQARIEFDREVETTEALRFPLRRLIGELVGSLRGQDAAIQRITLSLDHADRDTTAIRLRPARPTRDGDQLLQLIEERFGQLHLAAPVRALHLTAGRYLTYTPAQDDLFDHRAQQVEALAQLIDRLQARLGDEAVTWLQTIADHRPECASRSVATPDSGDASQGIIQGKRPLWLLSAPKPLTTPPTLLSGPERIEGGWWEKDVARDYYIACTADGQRLWVFRDREARWYLHGVFA